MCSETSILHPAEEAFERYLLHQSSDQEVEAIETHYLACEDCVAKLEQIDVQIRATKLALENYHLEKTALSVSRQQSKAKSWWGLASFGTAGALAMAAVLMVSAVPSIHQNKLPTANIELTAYRGAESQILPRDRQVHVVLNAEGLGLNDVIVSLVDGNGVEIWTQQAAIRNGSAAIELPAIHTTGTHFLRLFAPTAPKDAVREFSTDVQ